ncbi:tRNA (N6-isopentenyl adenosine(37)-C2)-methylthiotransferase MiaB [Salisediminibacterium selenitireducens]|uniref:tRNA-2-methylthio-N(6)-dimethylallyladenosine synthase n=1 Tax=Bacillus selenitireducens (strain ATCC 700615 / DSM 15326 / MLS10) TaxID=439292 RepID=D6XU41_BACIE|nr:tRNA (N6-isopentenyl adenosine(37)-C2)-methylthiotransferase MiaB [Salisediminibacterium selenitireducens]ADH99327.1 tRNA-i(6)A37 thiotransferase enzyme MiaB [[Bacillus] selenitireducens MLS10]
MNEEQRKYQEITVEQTSSADKKSGQAKDYSQYFQATYQPPDLKSAKKRGKEDVFVHYDFEIPEDMANIGRGKKFLIRTYGCQMNEHDSENMAGILLEMGFESTVNQDEADVILLNTCAIRENAENKVFGEIGNLKVMKRENPGLIVGVCGCMSQEESVVNRILQKHQHVDLIFGTHNIHRLPELIKNAIFSKEMIVEVWSQEGDIIENMPRARKGQFQGWVNIMYGCDKFCTYCIVPFTRGKERSRRPEDVIEEVRHLARNGYKEITLLGQNVNAYGKDLLDSSYRLADLLDDIRDIGIPRVRFTTSHPWDFDDELIDVIAKGGNMMEHIHLPVQSGNNDVLKIMNRKYTREEYVALADKIKEKIPHATLTTDIIVGYPNETEEQFQDTLSLVKEMAFDAAYTYVYSAREGTPAAAMEDDVPKEVKKDRLQRLNEVVNRHSAMSNERMRDRTVEVLVEGESKKNPDVLMGRTRTNKLVNFKAPKSVIGELVYVKITDAKSWSLNGELVSEAEVAQL